MGQRRLTLVYVGCYTRQTAARATASRGGCADPDTGALRPAWRRRRTAVAVVPGPASPPARAVRGQRAGRRRGQRLGRGAPTAAHARSAAAPTGGAHPCHLAVVPGRAAPGRARTTAAAVSPYTRSDRPGVPGERTDLVAHDGHGPDPDRQERAHAHMVSPDADGKHLRVVDLGADASLPIRARRGRLRRSAAVSRTPAGHRSAAPGPGRDGWLYWSASWTRPSPAYRPDPASGLDARGGAGRRRARDGRPGASRRRSRSAPTGGSCYVANRGPTRSRSSRSDGLPRHVTRGGDRRRLAAPLRVDRGFLYVANERSHTRWPSFEVTRIDGRPCSDWRGRLTCRARHVSCPRRRDDRRST